MVAYAHPVLRCPELPSGHKRWHQMLPGEDNAGPKTPRAWTPGVRRSRGNVHLNTRLRLQLHPWVRSALFFSEHILSV